MGALPTVNSVVAQDRLTLSADSFGSGVGFKLVRPRYLHHWGFRNRPLLSLL